MLRDVVKRERRRCQGARRWVRPRRVAWERQDRRRGSVWGTERRFKRSEIPPRAAEAPNEPRGQMPRHAPSLLACAPPAGPDRISSAIDRPATLSRMLALLIVGLAALAVVVLFLKAKGRPGGAGGDHAAALAPEVGGCRTCRPLAQARARPQPSPALLPIPWRRSIARRNWTSACAACSGQQPAAARCGGGSGGVPPPRATKRARRARTSGPRGGAAAGGRARRRRRSAACPSAM